MKNYRFLLFIAVGVVIALPFLGTSEEERILALLEELRVMSEIREPESGIQQLARARQIGSHFSEQTTFDLTSTGYQVIHIENRQELTGRIARARSMLDSLELTLDNPQVTIRGDSAQVELTGSALGSLRDVEGQFLDIHRVAILLEKTDNTWFVVGGRHIRNERSTSNQE